MSALQEAIKRTKPVEFDTGNAVDVHQGLVRGRFMSGRMFGIEQEARDVVKERLLDLEARQRTEEYFRHHHRVLFDIEVLKWRHTNGLPKLVIFALDDPLFSVLIGYGFLEMRPKLPIAISDQYDDVVALLRRKVRQTRRSPVKVRRAGGISISVKFTGVIPEEAREKIIEARKYFDQVFIVAEPVGMKLNMRAKLPPDPVVVGWDGAKLWYICDFDTTPIEEAALLIGPANRSVK